VASLLDPGRKIGDGGPELLARSPAFHKAAAVTAPSPPELEPKKIKPATPGQIKPTKAQQPRSVRSSLKSAATFYHFLVMLDCYARDSWKEAFSLALANMLK
jgi:hypothetical protein